MAPKKLVASALFISALTGSAFRAVAANLSIDIYWWKFNEDKMLNPRTTRRNEIRIFSGKRYCLYRENLSLDEAQKIQKMLREEKIRSRRLKGVFGYTVYEEYEE